VSALGQAHAETEIDRLVAASKIIANKIQQGRNAVGGLAYYAVDGKIAPDGTVLPAFITPAEVQAYNDSVSDVSQRIYYNTQMMLEDQYNDTMVKLEEAIDTFVDATAVIAVAVEVADKAETTDQNSVAEQEQLQDFVQENDVMLEQQDVNVYNDALGDVEDLAQDAAAFLAASRIETITGSVDEDTQQFNINMSDAIATYDSANEAIKFAWSTTGFTHTFYNFFSYNNATVTVEDVMGMGQTIYDEQESLN
tara:strand:+ start:420 stop:1175 length:756 start_codon:yes stop_codon:yes gene_type:complete